MDDLGARDLWPFCPWPQNRRGYPTVVEVKFARDGDPDDVVELIPDGPEPGAAHRARVVDPLSWYASRKPAFFPAILVNAGRRFQGECEWLDAHRHAPQAGDPGRPSMMRSSTPGPPPMIDDMLARSEDLATTLEYVGGPELDRILVDVVGKSKPMAEFERQHAYPTGSGQVALRVALFRLALHYGMVTGRWRP